MTINLNDIEFSKSVVAVQKTFHIAQKRLNTGDVTPTDTAQAEARFARRRLAVSQATYIQVIGNPTLQQQPDRVPDASRG